jgi:uroporphyrinogen decarboxylase
VNRAIGNDVKVGVGVCGPFSIAAELAGYENLLMGIYEQAEWVRQLLEGLTEHQKRYCDEIIAESVGITIFESWATPPLISPDIYKKYAMSYEKELINYIKNKGIVSIPLIIGGDTTEIADDIIETGTTLLLADYCVDLDVYLKKATEKGVTLRANIDPKLVERGDTEQIRKNIDKIIDIAKGYNKLVLGTGVIAYGTPSENILSIKRYIKNS